MFYFAHVVRGFKKMNNIWERAVSLYDTQMYKEALALFVFLGKYSPDDRITGFYISRCESLLDK